MLPAVNLYLMSAGVFGVTFLLFVPFINLVYKLKIRDPQRLEGRKDRFGDSDTVAIYDKIRGYKAGTPTGGGLLIVLAALIFYIFFYAFSVYEISLGKLILFLLGLVLYGLIGFFDDLKKVFKFSGLCLRVRYKLAIQLAAASLIAYWGIANGLFMIKCPFLGYEISSGFFLFALSVLTITFMSNAFNILDGIDGLSSGSLLITLIPLAIFVKSSTNDIADLVFIFILLGATMAYLYFNIKPARLFMGDTGALALGSIIGIITLTTGTLWLLPVFGMVYIVDALSSLIQWTSKYFFNGKKVFKIAPIHHHFEAIGWDDTKVVFRFWLAQAFFSLLALGLYFLVD